MDEAQIVKFLRCPAKDVVNLALAMANLTWKEETAVILCAQKDKTQERAAEEIGYSVDALQRWYRSGMRKLSAAWRGVWWIERLSE